MYYLYFKALLLHTKYTDFGFLYLSVELILLPFWNVFFSSGTPKFSKPGFNSTWTVNFQMFKLDLEKAEEQDQIANIRWIIKKAREFQKNIYLFFWLYQTLWLCGSQQTVEKSSRDGNTRPHNLPLRNLYAGQEATVKTGHGKTDWFLIGKGVQQGCILSPC